MHMNQVAIAYADGAQKAAIKTMLGLNDAKWVKDTVKARVAVLGRHGDYTKDTNVAELEFCMDMGGTQFELIRYTSGPNWIAEAARLGVAMPMVAHVGFHLDDDEDFPAMDGAKLAQEALTVEHSNEDVNKAGRRYHYRIYRVGPATYFKFIKRVTADEVDDVLKHAEHAGEGQLAQRQGNAEGEQVGGFMPPQGDETALAGETGSQQPGNDVAARATLPVGVDAAQAGLADPDHPQSDAAKEASEQAIKDTEARNAKEEERRANDERLRMEAAGAVTGGVDVDGRPVGAATTENSPSDDGKASEGQKEPDAQALAAGKAPTAPPPTFKGKGSKGK